MFAYNNGGEEGGTDNCGAHPEYFGGLTHLATNDFAASSLLTRQQLGWIPIGPSLLTDLRNMDYTM
jgi:hypothetical protein